MNIWMYVTDDEYELPMAVADTCAELAKLVGVTTNAIRLDRYRARLNGNKSRFVKVTVDSLED